jgi:ligand-binding sensor domain-containing protein
VRPRNIRVPAKWLVFPVLGLAFVSSPLPAQRYEFRNYGQEDGLTNLVVTSIAQDRQGFLWVGTQNGLFRYDGERFQGFFQSQGLPDSNVLTVHESGDGTLWAGTSTGLARWIGDRFEAVEAGRPFQITGRHSISSRSDGVIYAGTSEGLLVGRRKRDGSGYSWQFDSLPVMTGAIRSTCWDPRTGELWLGTSGGLFEIHDSRIERRGADSGVPPDQWGGLLADREGNVWIRSPGRLLVRRRGQQQFEAADRDLPKGGKGEMALTPTGQLLVSTSVGLAVRSGYGWDIIDTQRGLPADPVSAVFLDQEGSPWIGLSGSGLARWLGYPRWEGWNRTSGLSNSAIGGVVRDAFGTLWVGTDQGLNYRPAGKQSWHMWPPKQGLAKANISELTLDQLGKVWVVADDVVYRVDPNAKTAIRFGKESGLATERTVSVVVDREGAVWVACVDGLYRGRVRGRKLEFQRQLPNGRADSEAFGKVLADRSGGVWVAGTRGLHLFANGGWSRLTTRNGLSSDLVRYLAEAPDGTLWIGYGDAVGISHAVLSNGRIRVTSITQDTSLHPGRAYSLGVDHRGWVWVGTDSGMDRYNGRNWRHYDRADGLLWDDCNNAFLADEDGSVWLATSRGLSFSPL